MTISRMAARVAAAIGICLVFGRAQGADMTAVGPQVTAAQIIAAHGGKAEPVLRIVYDISTPSHQGTMTIDIASDFVFVKKTPSSDGPASAVLDDFGLRRFLTLDETHRTFSNDSAYMMVDFRYAESFNRKMLRGVLGRLGVAKQLPQAQNPYWDQQSLSVLAPNDDQPVVDQKPTSHGGIEYVVDGKSAARFETSAEALSADEEKGFARFLWNNGQLHPIVVAAILATGKVPAEVDSLNQMGNRQTTSIWKLNSVQRIAGSYPLTPDYQSDLPQKSVSEPLRSLLPTMLQAVAGRYGNGPRSAESYRAALADDLAKGQIFPYYVLDNEFALQYGMGVMGCLSHRAEATNCEGAQDIIQKYRADERTMAMINTLGIEQKGDIKTAIAQRKTISRDGVSDAYMFDLWIGNALTEGGDMEGALSLIPNAIRGNPYVGAFYSDLGDAFEKSFQPEEAWLCYDLARALPGGDKTPVVDGIAKKEQFLETHYPQFF